jgi:hypothetical protein
MPARRVASLASFVLVLGACRDRGGGDKAALGGTSNAPPAASQGGPTRGSDAAPNAIDARFEAAFRASRGDASGEDGASAAAGAGAGYEPATRRACRVMALRGGATVRELSSFDGGVRLAEGRALTRGDLLPAGGVIESEMDADLTVQWTVSTREITFAGAVRAEACPSGDEIVRLARGRVTAMPGAGVRPGAEVWVATPLGVVRFNDARLEIDVPSADAARIHIAVLSGQASFVPAANVVVALPAGDAAPASDVHAMAPGSILDARRPNKPLAAWLRDLVASCIGDTDRAEKAGSALSAEHDRAKAGDLAFAHVRARQKGRASCESAYAGALSADRWDAATKAALERSP